jgi:ABC-type bacteriocin/lantibiotic exporter with double-glycine peptidase domain
VYFTLEARAFCCIGQNEKELYCIADPAIGLAKLSKDEFEKCWVEIYESGNDGKGIRRITGLYAIIFRTVFSD